LTGGKANRKVSCFCGRTEDENYGNFSIWFGNIKLQFSISVPTKSILSNDCKLYHTPRASSTLRFVDVYEQVTQTVALPVESYALKSIARGWGF